ncbi:DUF4139 domain-containing protein [Chryseolinea lacunae]|uniref:Mucoidy inhibitor MuiA family protein n=1 Tax=Chryseolinea lacunae TaxID=2801331 RepID=A0ABS1KS20_9BACT|nr:DUF4139 domain-containing protein [Chryseolinea lacunae]MBL0742278.1 mucoidy inhibitor MuiA family protein [Chryseolinea lacunae]
MKRLSIIILLVAFVLPMHAQENEQKVTSKISQVTVFLQGAEVSRQATVPLKPGVSILTLTGIAPDIQQQSIQVQGPLTVKILAVSFGVDYLETLQKPDRIKTLEGEKKRLTGLIAQEKSLEEVYREEENMLKTNKSIGGAEKGVEVQELKAAVEYFRLRLLDIRQQLMQTATALHTYQDDLAKVEAQLIELRHVKAQPTGQIVVKVSTKTATTAEFLVKYLVREARWFPSYDIRAKNITSPVSITYKANVSQQSGEDWENVNLTISSADPSESGTRPIIKPWIVGYNNGLAQRDMIRIRGTATIPANNIAFGKVTDDAGEPLPGVNVMIKGTTVGTVTDMNGNYSLPLTSDATTMVLSFIGYKPMERQLNGGGLNDIQLRPDMTQLSEVVVTGYGTSDMSGLEGMVAGVEITKSRVKKMPITATEVIRQTNVEFALTEPFSIKSDGESRATDMVEYELKALYEYYCAPKLDPDAFLTAKILDWDQYNFLDGEASLFFEGKYIGKSILDTRNTSDTLTVSLGRDNNVLVKREKKKEYSSRQFIGANQKVVMAYELSIRNKKALPITIVLQDQIPVSNEKEISVDILEDSHADLDAPSGVMTWKKEIAPGKNEVITLRYSVRYPKGNRMLLE